MQPMESIQHESLSIFTDQREHPEHTAVESIGILPSVKCSSNGSIGMGPNRAQIQTGKTQTGMQDGGRFGLVCGGYSCLPGRRLAA